MRKILLVIVLYSTVFALYSQAVNSRVFESSKSKVFSIVEEFLIKKKYVIDVSNERAGIITTKQKECKPEGSNVFKYYEVRIVEKEGKVKVSIESIVTVGGEDFTYNKSDSKFNDLKLSKSVFRGVEFNLMRKR